MEPIPFARKFYDFVLLEDGLTELDLRERVKSTGGEAWREYVRWNFSGKEPSRTQAALAAADREYFDRSLAHGVERGWLIKKGQKYYPGVPPPEHKPLTTVGNTERALRQVLYGPKELEALEALRNGSLRNTKFTNRPELKASLKTFGQLYPILRLPLFGGDTVIIDGITRHEILSKELKVPEDEIKYDDLDSNLTILEAVQLRTTMELNSTSKDVSQEARDKYIASLQALGLSQQDIGKIVKVTQQRVSQVINSISPDTQARTPTTQEVNEFRWLSDAGWNVRAIAERTGWSKSTVNNYLKGVRTVQPTKSTASKTARPAKTAKTERSDVLTAAKEANVKPITAAKGGTPSKTISGIMIPATLEEVLKNRNVVQTFLMAALDIPEYAAFLKAEMAKRGI